MKAFRETLLAVIGLLIIVLLILLFIIRKYTKSTTISEGFSVSIPHDISIDFRSDISDFIDAYTDLAQQVCAVQNVVVDGIAKTLSGVQTEKGPTKAQLSQAQSKARVMALGQIFDCVNFPTQLASLSKDPFTIKDLYNLFDDIPDNVGFNMWNSMKFSVSQLKSTYDMVQKSISSATEGKIPETAAETAAETTGETAAETIPEGFEDSRCKSTELCPSEMAQQIITRLPFLKASLDQAVNGFPTTTATVSINDYLKQGNDLIQKLNSLKEQAQAGTLLNPAS